MTEAEGRGREAPLPVVVIGAGMSGLTAAWWLHQANIPVTVLERGEHAGGAVATRTIGGHVFEKGPTTLMAKAPALNELVDAIGLRSEVVHSREASHRRLIWRGGGLHEAPAGPMGLLTSSLMPFGAKVRLLREPWVRPKRDDADETLRAFLERRFGRGGTAALGDPFVTGVFAGRLEELGADAFPRLVAFERSHGSVMRGMMAARRMARQEGNAVALQRGLFSFAEGLEQLPRRIRKELGTRLRFGHEVFGLEPVMRDGESRWIVRAVAGGRHVDYDASSVIIATPSTVAQSLLERVDTSLAEPLAHIPHPHVATVGLGYRQEAVAHPLDAFGLLCSSEQSELSDTGVLGVVFASSIFEGRAPQGGVTLTVMMGGSRHPECAEWEDSRLVDQARAALAVLVGVRGFPDAVDVTRWPQAIPQYQPGHTRRIASLYERLQAFPGLHVVGNYLEGVGLEQAVATGASVARHLLVASR